MANNLYLRIGRHTLAVARQTTEGELQFAPFSVNGGISMPANLREAFLQEKLLAQPADHVQVLIDSDALTVPIELFSPETAEAFFHHAFEGNQQDCLCYNVLPNLKSVAIFALNKDLRTVITDHFTDAKIIAVACPVWRNLLSRSYIGSRRKLYGWFHENRLELFSFQQSRFKFCNSFEISGAHDALYFTLYVWKQLQLQASQDEIHIVGDIPEREWLLGQLKKFVGRAYAINPTADFNRAPATAIVGMPYDLMTLICKGR